MGQEELRSLGFVCDFLPVKIGQLGDSVWQGVAERYWNFEMYYLPLGVLSRPPSAVSAGASSKNHDLDVKDRETGWRCWPVNAVSVDDRVGAGPCADAEWFETPPVTVLTASLEKSAA